jgi:hypothetical protein
VRHQQSIRFILTDHYELRSTFLDGSKAKSMSTCDAGEFLCAKRSTIVGGIGECRVEWDGEHRAN